jgi:tetratricopeptide (TPR) repeat protein
MKFTTSAIALAAVATAAPALAQYENRAPMNSTPQVPQVPEQTAPTAQPQQGQSAQIVTHTPKVSKEAMKALQDLQTSVNAKDMAAIPAKVAAAQAVAKTGDDRYVIGLMQLKAGANAKDNAMIASGIEAMLASGSVAANEQYPLYLALGQAYSGADQGAKAAQAYQHALQLNPSSVESIAGAAEAKATAGQSAEAVALLQKGIALQQASGQKAPEAWYRRAVALAYDAKQPAAVDIARQWLAAYPSTASWHDALTIYRNLYHPDVGNTLDLLRLASAAGSMSDPADYAIYAESAAEQGNFGEAEAIIAQGQAAGKVNPSDPLFRDLVAGLKAKQVATDADLAEAAKTATSNGALMGIGDRYYGMGNYSKAVELYRAALAKGADASLANLHIGMALARSGDKAGATAALNAVTGPRAELAKYWLIYLNTHA